MKGAPESMPTYDYHCAACSQTFEVSRPMGASGEDVTCPECDRLARRVFSPVGVAFKGSGFHNTDYRPRPAAGAEPSCSKSADSPGCAGCPASASDG